MRLLSRARALLDAHRSRSESRWDQVVVVFTRDDRAVAQMDIASGPCIPSPNRKRPLVGVTNQQPGQPRRYEALFRILIADSSALPWASFECEGRACLYVFSDTFVGALASLNRDALRRQVERPHDYDWIFEQEREVVRRWMPEASWPLGATNVPVEGTELGGAAAWARVAQDRGRRLYCWSGPGFNPWATPEYINRIGRQVRT